MAMPVLGAYPMGSGAVESPTLISWEPPPTSFEHPTHGDVLGPPPHATAGQPIGYGPQAGPPVHTMPPQMSAGGQGYVSHYPGPPIQTTKTCQGPEGCNLFIFHIPNDLTNVDLYNLFVPFGSVISARIMVENETGRSRGFGFVSFDNRQSADHAIKSMNGYQIGRKRLKVQHKKDRNEISPPPFAYGMHHGGHGFVPPNGRSNHLKSGHSRRTKRKGHKNSRSPPAPSHFEDRDAAPPSPDEGELFKEQLQTSVLEAALSSLHIDDPPPHSYNQSYRRDHHPHHKYTPHTTPPAVPSGEFAPPGLPSSLPQYGHAFDTLAGFDGRRTVSDEPRHQYPQPQPQQQHHHHHHQQQQHRSGHSPPPQRSPRAQQHSLGHSPPPPHSSLFAGESLVRDRNSALPLAGGLGMFPGSAATGSPSAASSSPPSATALAAGGAVGPPLDEVPSAAVTAAAANKIMELERQLKQQSAMLEGQNKLLQNLLEQRQQPRVPSQPNPWQVPLSSTPHSPAEQGPFSSFSDRPSKDAGGLQ